QELGAALCLVLFADCVGCLTERGKRPQEAPVRDVIPGHRTVTPPPVSAQRVQAAVVAGAGEGVRLDRATGGERVLGKRCPRRRRGGVGGGSGGGTLAGGEPRHGWVVGQLRRRGEQVAVTHEVSEVPAERRSSHAFVTRAAMPVSASLRNERGS